METCEYCGFSEILNGYNFCPKCGSAIWKDEFDLEKRKSIAGHSYKEWLVKRKSAMYAQNYALVKR